MHLTPHTMTRHMHDVNVKSYNDAEYNGYIREKICAAANTHQKRSRMGLATRTFDKYM